MTQVFRIAAVDELHETRMLTKLSRSGIAPICGCPSPKVGPWLPDHSTYENSSLLRLSAMCQPNQSLGVLCNIFAGLEFCIRKQSKNRRPHVKNITANWLIPETKFSQLLIKSLHPFFICLFALVPIPSLSAHISSKEWRPDHQCWSDRRVHYDTGDPGA